MMPLPFSDIVLSLPSLYFCLTGFSHLSMNSQPHCLEGMITGPILFQLKGKIMLDNGVTPRRSSACCPDII